MTTVSTRDPHSLSFNQTMGGYSEDILRKIGINKMEAIEKTTRLGYFHFIIPPNSRSNKTGKGMR